MIISFSFIGLSLFFLNRFSSFYPHDLGVTWRIGNSGFKRDLLRTIWITFLFCIFFIILCNLARLFFGITEIKKREALLLLSGIIAPYCEELFFRGILSALLLRHNIRWPAIIILSGLIFGPIHLISPEYLFSQVITATLLGFYFGWVYYKTRSLVLPTILHTMVNGLNLLLQLYPDLRRQLDAIFIWV
jgi:membrane protease YdiL (CAAX protease family)